MMIRPLLLLEINEVPWRVIDRFKADVRYGALNRFFRESRTFTNVAVDRGELSPWITWPTFHRGMTRDGHGIRNPGSRSGDFSRHSDLGGIPPARASHWGFRLPAKLAADQPGPRRLLPSRYICSRLLLHSRIAGAVAAIQSSANGRQWPGGESQSGVFQDTVSLVKDSGPRSSAVDHRVRREAGPCERFDEARVSRRPIFQAILFWDVFRKLFACQRPPAFTSFFTNHVAGIMHRYWRDVFPEDFHGADAVLRQWLDLSTMEFAVKVVDRVLADAMDYCKRNPDLVVVFATSMGQSAIHRDYHEGIEAALTGVGELIEPSASSRIPVGLCSRWSRRSRWNSRMPGSGMSSFGRWTPVKACLARPCLGSMWPDIRLASLSWFRRVRT